MKKIGLLVVLFSLVMFYICPCISQTLIKDEMQESSAVVVADQSAVKQVKVGLYILNIGKFDIATGEYVIDFYLTFRCKDKCPEINYEFMNGRAASVDKITDTPHEKLYRVQANLCSSVDLKKFPFDDQRILLSLEDKKLTVEHIEYLPDFEHIAIDQQVSITGWNMDKWKAETTVHEYKIYNEKYSQFVFSVPISRIVINSILKTLLPVIFIVLVMLASFILGPDKLSTRIAMVSSALVASVMFHVSLANQIPPVGYLTFMDKFMVLTYFVVLSCFIVNVILLELLEREKMHLVQETHLKTKYAMFVFIPTIYALFFIFVR